MTSETLEDLLQGAPETVRSNLKRWLGVEQISDDALLAIRISRRYAQKLEAVRRYPDAVRHLLMHPPKVAGFAHTMTPQQKDSLALAGKAAKSIAQWVKGGMKYVDEEIREKRMQACLACPHLMDGETGVLVQKLASAVSKSKKNCSLCGCNVSAKGRFPHESCPAPHPEKAGFTRWDEPANPDQILNQAV